MIAENIRSIAEKIARSCEKIGKPSGTVQLICVTKTASIPQIEEVLSAGYSAIGENRIQDALIKYDALGDRATWHLIGHLQTNKVKDAVKIFSLIHSVDSIRLAREIDKESKKIGKRQDILIQVNVSGEETKFGITPSSAFECIDAIRSLTSINVVGLMTIVPEVADAETVRPFFKALRELRDAINTKQILPHELRILSMGMTNDFEVAIEEGSNMVRIGRAVFQP